MRDVQDTISFTQKPSQNFLDSICSALFTNEQLPNHLSIEDGPHLLDLPMSDPVEYMLGKLDRLPRWLESKKLLLEVTVQPNTRSDSVIGREQHLHVEVEVRSDGEACFYHVFVVLQSHTLSIIDDIFMDEGGKRGVSVYSRDVIVEEGFQGRVWHLVL